MNTQPVLDYIQGNWTRSFYQDAPGTGFRGMDLPFPYTSPCIKGEGKFSFFFYWDTYFTNLGLLRAGHAEMAKNNIRNMLWFIRRQGYMPNHTALFNRSQSPYLCRMVKEYIEATGDDAFLPEAAEGLRQEYHFWTTARMSPVGLNRYGHHETEEGCARFYDGTVVARLGLPQDVSFEEKVRVGGHFMANAEATCDFSNRFESRCLDYCQVDLNALLFEYETYLAACSQRLGWDDQQLWLDRNARRAERMNRYFWNESEGLFYDYDCVERKAGPVPAQTGYQTMSAGMASAEQARRMVASLPRFERAHGMAYTPETDDCRRYQWAYPNVWPPLAYMLVDGLRRYGYADDARRLARKYVETAARLFAKTGRLWEKTDAETGEVAGGEYDAAPMIGWSAGVFVALNEYLAQSV
jgi:alpha,alpha-trehalase